MKIRALLLTATALSASLVLAGCAAGASTPDKTPAESPAPTRSGTPQAELDAQLITAAWANDVEEAARLIGAGADVNAKDSTVQSAYLISTSEGYLPLLELTIEHGADMTSLDSWDGTGLIRAAERGHADIVGRLIQTGIDVDHVNNLGWIAVARGTRIREAGCRRELRRHRASTGRRRS